MMSVQKVRLHSARRPPAQADELRSRLIAEWRDAGTVDPRPQIIEETDRGETVHIYAIWDEWGTMSQQDRSEILMDAFEEANGQQRALHVVVAMGLTRAEADRMGITHE
jgi:hypothetical protein